MSEVVDVAIVGGGQAGLSLSYWLTHHGVGHVVLERAQIGESWRSQRWESFCLVTPNWTIQLPGLEYNGNDADGFMARDAFISYLERYAHSFDAPVRQGVGVRAVDEDNGGYHLATSAGDLRAGKVVIAAGMYQTPRLPAFAGAFAGAIAGDIAQLHAGEYREPAALADGAVLVVGSAQSGCQIAEELQKAGRPVFLSVSNCGRLPRRYRGRDCIAWQNDLGFLDRTPEMLENPSLRFGGDPHLTGSDGGRTLSLHQFARDGMTLLGRVAGAEGHRLSLAADLHDNMATADAYAETFFRTIDEHIAATGIDAPAPAPDNTDDGGPMGPLPPNPPATLDLARAGIRTIIWATGFSFDYSWVRFPVFDAAGFPVQQRGVSPQPGLYFLGMNFLYKRKSGIIFGVGEDARYLAEHIAGRGQPQS